MQWIDSLVKKRKRRRQKKRQIRELRIIPPVANAQRNGLAVVTKTLNDSDYVGEWVQFHLRAGVEHFYFYLDGSFDQNMPKYASKVPCDKCTFLPWQLDMYGGYYDQEINSQVAAFAHAISNFGSKFHRMAFIDIDEFLVPKGHKSIIDALQMTGEHPNVSLPWHMFGYSGHTEKPAETVVSSYTQRAKALYSASDDISYTKFKCIVDPCEIVKVGVHKFETKEFENLTCNVNGFIVPNSQLNSPEFISSENLQLNHYYTRSRRELESKISIGSDAGVSNSQHAERIREIVNEIEADTIEDKTAIEFVRQFGETREVSE